MKKNKKTKNLSQTLTYVAILVIVLAAVSVIYFMVNQSKTKDYTTLYEDIYNSCSEDGTTTLTSGKFVEIQVPTGEVDNYIKASHKYGRCLYKNKQ